MSKIKLGILAGGNSIEREVSLKSCDNVLNNLDKEKYDIHIFTIPNDQKNKWIDDLINTKPDVVVSTLHGGLGENGSMQGLLHCLNIPYVGSKVLASYHKVCIKNQLKLYSKQIIYKHLDIYILKGVKVFLSMLMK